MGDGKKWKGTEQYCNRQSAEIQLHIISAQLKEYNAAGDLYEQTRIVKIRAGADAPDQRIPVSSGAADTGAVRAGEDTNRKTE